MALYCIVIIVLPILFILNTKARTTLLKVKSDRVTSLLKTLGVNPSLLRVIVKPQIMAYRPFLNQPPINFLTSSPRTLLLTYTLPATLQLHLEYARPASAFGPQFRLFALPGTIFSYLRTWLTSLLPSSLFSHLLLFNILQLIHQPLTLLTLFCFHFLLHLSLLNLFYNLLMCFICCLPLLIECKQHNGKDYHLAC